MYACVRACVRACVYLPLKYVLYISSVNVFFACTFVSQMYFALSFVLTLQGAAASTRAQATAQPPRPGDTPSTRAQAAAQPPRSGAASVPPPATAPTAAQQPAAAAAPATAAQRPSSASPAVAASSGPSFSQRFASKLGWRRESAPAAPGTTQSLTTCSFLTQL